MALGCVQAVATAENAMAVHTALAQAWTDEIGGVSAAIAAETRLMLECFRERVWLNLKA